MNKKAFTLMELIIAVAILGILASVIAPKILETHGKKEQAKIIQGISEEVRGAIKGLVKSKDHKVVMKKE